MSACPRAASLKLPVVTCNGSYPPRPSYVPLAVCWNSTLGAVPSSRSTDNSVLSTGPTAALSRRPLLVALLGLLLILIVLDRMAWASVAGWREDPATTIWLGYTRSVLDMPVGLISSMRIPNPNGLVLASVLLSRLPNLLAVSTLLGVIHAGLFAWVSWLGTRDLKLASFAAGPLLASITLRGASVELWGLWTSIPVNFLFMAGLLIYIHSRNPWALPLVVLAIVIGPSLYFSGLANSIVFSILAVAAGLRWRPRRDTRAWLAPVLVALATVALSVWLTWLPYFRQVSPAELSGAAAAWSRTPWQRLLAASASALTFPLFSVQQFAGPRLFAIGQVEPHLLSAAAWTAHQWLLHQTLIQALICYASILGAAAMVLLRRISPRDVIRPERRLPAVMVALFVAGVMISYMIAPSSAARLGRRVSGQTRSRSSCPSSWCSGS